MVRIRIVGVIVPSIEVGYAYDVVRYLFCRSFARCPLRLVSIRRFKHMQQRQSQCWRGRQRWQSTIVVNISSASAFVSISIFSAIFICSVILLVLISAVQCVTNIITLPTGARSCRAGCYLRCLLHGGVMRMVVMMRRRWVPMVTCMWMWMVVMFFQYDDVATII